MNIDKMGVPLKGFADFSRKVAAEGAVLLKNEEQNLPINEGENLSIFGRTQINYYRSGTGSGGSVNVPYTTNLLEGLRNKKKIVVNEDLATLYEKWVLKNSIDTLLGPGLNIRRSPLNGRNFEYFQKIHL